MKKFFSGFTAVIWKWAFILFILTSILPSFHFIVGCPPQTNCFVAWNVQIIGIPFPNVLLFQSGITNWQIFIPGIIANILFYLCFVRIVKYFIDKKKGNTVV